MLGGMNYDLHIEGVFVLRNTPSSGWCTASFVPNRQRWRMNHLNIMRSWRNSHTPDTSVKRGQKCQRCCIVSPGAKHPPSLQGAGRTHVYFAHFMLLHAKAPVSKLLPAAISWGCAETRSHLTHQLQSCNNSFSFLVPNWLRSTPSIFNIKHRHRWLHDCDLQRDKSNKPFSTPPLSLTPLVSELDIL